MKKHKAASSSRRRRNNGADAKATLTTAATGRNGGGGAPTAVKAVALPVEFLRWFLVQSSEDYRVPALDDYSPPPAAAAEERETTVRRVSADVQATKDGFAAFQAWVRGVADKGSRVVLGRTSNPRELQEIIDAEWAEARRELGMGGGDGVVAGSDKAAANKDDGEGNMAAVASSS